MDAMRPSHHHRMAMFEGSLLQDGDQLIEIFQDQVQGFGHLDRKRSIDNVRRGQAHVEEAMLGSYGFHERLQEGDHIVLRHLLDFRDARDIDDGFLSNARAGPSWNLPLALEGRTGLQFDFQPDFVLVLQIPDCAHPGAGITVNHVCLVARSGMAEYPSLRFTRSDSRSYRGPPPAAQERRACARAARPSGAPYRECR